MKKYKAALGLWLIFSSFTFAADEPLPPIGSDMSVQVYLCGLRSQLADITKGKKRDALVAEANQCADSSREKIKARVKNEFAKYAEADPLREKLKALYSSYLTYMSAAMAGKNLTESAEAISFNSRLNDYRSEIELR